MISLSDAQVIRTACDLAPEKRDVYLQRIAVILAVRGRGHFGDNDVTQAAQQALTGLTHQPAA
jgi:hypothetical protein